VSSILFCLVLVFGVTRGCLIPFLGGVGFRVSVYAGCFQFFFFSSVWGFGVCVVGASLMMAFSSLWESFSCCGGGGNGLGVSVLSVAVGLVLVVYVVIRVLLSLVCSHW